jgi:hypothetical protein
MGQFGEVYLAQQQVARGQGMLSRLIF